MSKDPYKRLLSSVIAEVTAEFESMQGDLPADSPIERLFITALCSACSFLPTSQRLFIVAEDGEAVERIKVMGKSFVIVEAQKQIENWRVDYLIHAYDNGWPNRSEGWMRLIVECDGHDFHERTKAQAARDRSRDRRAQDLGIPMYRFTGGEIWNDPLGCAQQVMGWIARGS